MDRRWSLAALSVALAFITTPAAFAADSDPPASAGWHGREIRDPLPPANREVSVRFPRGWSAGGVARGTGYASAEGSRRVREVQRRLLRRGYRAGPVDGRFGPRTRAAVTWFQIKHGLPRTGRVDAASIAALRENREMDRVRSTAPEPNPPAVAASAPAQREPAGSSWPLLLLALVILPGATLIALWARTRRRERAAPAPEEQSRSRLTVLRSPAPSDVLGYVASARGDLNASARMIGSWCEERGWRLERVVQDVMPAGGRTTDRPGLAYVLDQIEDGRVAGVVVARLSDLSRSFSELARLLERIDEAEAFLIALDHDLDTSAPTTSPAATHGRWDAPRRA